MATRMGPARSSTVRDERFLLVRIEVCASVAEDTIVFRQLVRRVEGHARVISDSSDRVLASGHCDQVDSANSVDQLPEESFIRLYNLVSSPNEVIHQYQSVILTQASLDDLMALDK
jgi:hypothetical protein